MASINPKTRQPRVYTHEGARGHRGTTLQQLKRAVMSTMLWEDTFYEGGASIADRIVEYASALPAAQVAEVAIAAREESKLRHVPLLLLNVIAKTGAGTSLVSDTIARVIQRPDELTEFLAIYWKKGKTPLSAQVKKGLARAFVKFDEYQLAKYNRDTAIKLRDVLFLVHPKPQNDAQQAVWNRLAAGTLQTPDTWETRLSTGQDKKQSFEELLKEGKLGYMALLRNLRLMDQQGVDPSLIRNALLDRKGAQRVLPFRFLSAAKHAPQYAKQLNQALLASIEGQPEFKGTTVVVVDTSGSMSSTVSGKSELQRYEAGAALACLVNSEHVRLFHFATDFEELPFHPGLPGIQAVVSRSGRVGHGTDMGKVIRYINANIPHDRIIIVSDMQSHSGVPDPVCKHAYMINVAAYQNGVGYDKWVRIDGWSENTLKYMWALENEDY